MKSKLSYGLLIALCVTASGVWPDSLELKNGSLIKGKFMGGTETEVSFQVGSSLQKYSVADIVALKFDSAPVSDMPPRSSSSVRNEPTLIERANTGPAERSNAAPVEPPSTTPTGPVSIPAGTTISVRTIDGIDSTRNRVGDRFQASLDEPLTVDGNVIVPKGADVYGRLTDSKTSGTFAGRSELRLELTGIVVNGQTVPIVTGDYELTGKSRGASTAKRTVGGAAVGTIIGAIAGGGKGAAIGAGVGAGVGAGSEIITKGDQVKVPSETLIDFALQQDVWIPGPRN